jgi:hypothetical protein
MGGTGTARAPHVVLDAEKTWGARPDEAVLIPNDGGEHPSSHRGDGFHHKRCDGGIDLGSEHCSELSLGVGRKLEATSTLQGLDLVFDPTPSRFESRVSRRTA